MYILYFSKLIYTPKSVRKDDFQVIIKIMSLSEILKEAGNSEEGKPKPLIGILVIILILGFTMLMSVFSGPQKREFTGPPEDNDLSLPGENNVNVSEGYTEIDVSEINTIFSDELLRKIQNNEKI